MKKLWVFLLAVMTGVAALQGQTSITLTFTATDNGLFQPLDSIRIHNLSQGGDTILVAPDTILLLENGIGINDWGVVANNRWTLYPIVPNPTANSATVRLYLPLDEDIQLKLSDISGRELVLYRHRFTKGLHTFDLNPGGEALCFLTVHGESRQQVQRLVSLQRAVERATITYAGYEDYTLLQQRSLAMFPWIPGDQLRFIGYSANGIDTLVDQPVQSTQYTFQYESVVCPSTVTDFNGNQYNVVKIYKQCWMKENLQARNYRSGSVVPECDTDTLWINTTIGARCWYMNDSATYGATYGSLYNWLAVIHPDGLCPTGWHVPTDAEFTVLTSLFGGNAIAGGPLKEAGNTHWVLPNTGATNASGFTALPGGERFGSTYNMQGGYGHWWTSTTNDPVSAWIVRLGSSDITVGRWPSNRKHGFSVRCVMN